jgi:hypothetical protein
MIPVSSKAARVSLSIMRSELSTKSASR